jgi:GlpG protein
MRQIGTLADGDAARTLTDYLLTRHIQTQLLPEGGGWSVWVCDEDRVEQARVELAAFQANPTDPRFAGAATAAKQLRAREDEVEQSYRRRQEELRRRMRPSGAATFRVTLALTVASCGVTLLAGTAFLGPVGGKINLANPVLETVLIQSWPDYAQNGRGLHEVAAGEIWRLVTPIFLHFGPLHLLFNMLMLRDLGGAIELRRGTGRLLLLVLALAVPSNLAQYYWPFVWADGGLGWTQTNPLFGGMSGVLYGLFGYAWMKSRFAPELGLYMHPNTVVLMIGWFFLCITGVIGSVANTAHAAGLAMGILIGAAPHLLPRRQD